MDTKGKEYLFGDDLKSTSMWIVHRSDDLLYPVNSAEDLPEDMLLEDLYIRVNFTTKKEERLFGCILGLRNIYCIVIFLEKETIYLNKNMQDECLIAIKKINKMTNKRFTIEDFSPVKYETQIDISGFKNFQGDFNISIPMTDDERINLPLI